MDAGILCHGVSIVFYLCFLHGFLEDRSLRSRLGNNAKNRSLTVPARQARRRRGTTGTGSPQLATGRSLRVEGCVLAVPVVPPAETRLGPASKFGLWPAEPALRRAGGLACAASAGVERARPASRQAAAGWDMSRLCPTFEGKEVNF
jgi:hypothetical protein